MSAHQYDERDQQGNELDSNSPSPSTTPSLRGSQIGEVESNLNELAAPPPIYDPSEGSVKEQAYLENQHTDNSHGSRSQLQEEEPGNERAQDEPQTSGSDWVDTSEKPSRRSSRKFLRLTYIVSYLIVFSIAGTLLRLVIECLTFYPGSPVNTSVLWANIGGSLLMGFLSEDQELFRIGNPRTNTNNPTVHKKTIPLYIGLTTGFCGSLTSFSTFIRDGFLALSNDLPVPNGPYSEVSLFTSAPIGATAPNGGFSFMALVAVLITEVGLSLAGLFFGAHLAIGVAPQMPNIPQRWLSRVLDPVTVIIAILLWVAIICLVVLLPTASKQITLWSPEIWRGPVLFSLVFAPVGCLARFFISLKLNGRIASFPLGTFVVNVGGTMILGMAYSLQHASISGVSFVGCQVLQGVMDGFCGCLTTVSTWILELADLRKRHAYLYATLSIVVALCALILEIGILKWTRGLVSPSCFC